ncbi:COR domain-containing protein [Aliikangiella coralliicola]|uniref:Uncharacterized protein n=1 Tax=Aliikangiella coralliicola TaxID=2592383 RepID=A0A545UJ85_9GAMM|nr:COR domain-containing protein [Aliikangiella coralliicola]TQV89534.1 hypothetical protein FLL46_01225 [Aliikangiella coralliicola]
MRDGYEKKEPVIINARVEEAQRLLTDEYQACERLALLGPTTKGYGDLHPYWISQLDLFDLVIYLSEPSVDFYRFFRNVSHIRSLAIWKISLKDQISAISQFSSLSALSLVDSRLGVKALSSLSQLTSLMLGRNNINDKQAKVLSTMEQLVSLDLVANEIGDLGAKALSTMGQLTALQLGWNNIGKAGAEALSKMERLTSLDLTNNNIGGGGVKALSTMRQLTSLRLGWNNIDYDGAKALSALDHLTSLDLGKNKIGDDGAKALSGLNHLTSLDIGGNRIGDDGAKALSGLNHLTSLDIGGNRIGDDGAKALSGLNHLTSLDLGDNNIGDDGAKALSALDHLTSLDLERNNIGDDGAKALSALDHLTSLALGGNNIGDDGAKALSALDHLTSLDLGGNRIGDDGAKVLSKMGPLTALRLGWNNIGDDGAKALSALDNLTSLDLGRNNIGDDGAKALSALEQLTSLGLSGNKIGDNGAKALSELEQLTSLDLDSNKLGDDGAKALSMMGLLTALRLSWNNIGDGGAKALSALKQLTFLALDNNKIGDDGAKALSALRHLTSLDLDNNKIGNDGVKALSALRHLTSLDLGNNKIGDDGAKALSALRHLTSLDLGNNKIGNDGVKTLSALEQLTSLDLGNNKIGDDGAKELSGMRRLNSLNLYNNELGVKGVKEISKLGQLTWLNLNSNQIGDEGAKALSVLVRLKSLSLNSNQIGDEGAKAMAAFRNLTYLDLNKNNLENSALLSLANLSQLTTLKLNKNPITNLAPLECLVQKGLAISVEEYLGDIEVCECPIKHPPPEIINQGRQAVLNYFAELRSQGLDQLFEAKMLVVGEGGAGKTSLIRRLYYPEQGLPKEEETTKGIHIEPIRFLLKDNREFRLNVWDFGGQHIYHATHQFFLTKRSLYVLVDSSRFSDKTVQDEVFKYWLGVIETLSDGCPVLIFQNQVGGRSKTIDQRGIKGRFAYVKDFYGSDLMEAESAEDIRAGIQHYAHQLEHIGDDVPAKWVSIRKEIETLANKKPYISRKEYFDLYSEHLEFDQERALFLSQYFHDLGVFLYFQDEPRLEKLVILQNEWATEAVFKVLDDESIKNSLGRFSQADCQRIWCDSVYEDMRWELLALMEKFELCYPLPDTDSKSWLATQLLPAEIPGELTSWSGSEEVCLLYRYDFLPKGIVNRLMVRMNRYVKRPELAWSYGVLFEKGATELLIQETSKGNEIILRSRGPEAKALLSVIAHDLDAINHSFEGLRNKVKKCVPCICEECVESDIPHLFEESHLIRKKDKNSLQVECQKSVIDVSVLELLEGLKLDLPDWVERGDTVKLDNQDGRGKSFKTKQACSLENNSTIRIFLASSQELADERDAFDLFLRRENDRLIKQGVYIKVIRWEYFLDAMSETRMQDEYNKAVKSCDIFVSLFKTKTGKYTEEEFDKAHEHFKQRGAPKIYTYFQETEVSSNIKYQKDLMSLWSFQKKLAELEHFYTTFKSIDDLILKFKSQLEILIEKGEFTVEPMPLIRNSESGAEI